jgi:hypothetical protein
MTAAAPAGSIMRADDPRGYEVVIPREIKRTERGRFKGATV